MTSLMRKRPVPSWEMNDKTALSNTYIENLKLCRFFCMHTDDATRKITIRSNIHQRLETDRTITKQRDGHKLWTILKKSSVVFSDRDSRQLGGSSSANGQSCSWLQTQRPGMQRPLRHRNWPGRHVELLSRNGRPVVVVVLRPEIIVISQKIAITNEETAWSKQAQLDDSLRLRE